MSNSDINSGVLSNGKAVNSGGYNAEVNQHANKGDQIQWEQNGPIWTVAKKTWEGAKGMWILDVTPQK